MKFLGVQNLSVTGDAGSGRSVWLAANLDPAESVVDLGGTGGMLAAWQPHEKILAYDDLSGFGPGHRILVPFQKGDVQSLPFQDQQFDVAVFAEVLEHVPRPIDALREAGRVAKRVLLTTPCEMRWTNGIGFRVSGHLRFYTLEILCDHLRRAGLDGTLSLLEFGGWSFFVGVLSANGGDVRDRMAQRVAPPALESVPTPPDTLLVMATLGRNMPQARAALTAVYQLASIPHMPFIVLDDASETDGQWFVQHGAACDYSPTRRGLVGAFNVGFQRFLANPAFRYLHLLEDGIQVTPGWDVALRRVLEAHPEFGWVACLQDENPAAPFTAMCSLISRAAAEAVGGFSKDFAPKHFDDGDMVLRLREKGFTPMAVPFRVSHPVGNTSPVNDDPQADWALLLQHKTRFRQKWGLDDWDWRGVEVHSCPKCAG